MNAGTNTSAARLWVPGDWNGFFGLFTNVLLNVIVLTGLCLGVVQLPPDTVFGRILPALGIALPLGNLFYAYLAWQLGKAEGRSDVTAMPYGPSVPHMFIVVFLVMLPVYLETKNPMMAWYAGLACFAIVLIAWTANVRLPGGLPGGLVAVIVGSVIGWVASLAGWSDYMQPAAVGKSLEHFGLHLPVFSNDVWTGLAKVAPLLATAIPLGIYNFTEAMNNVESASAAGDNYNLRKILLADGLGAVVGSMLGSPFPPAVYIGHPGWKSVGGRIGYSLATGVAIALVCFFGLTALLLAVIPLVAILPILLYIGLVIGAQAFQASPSRHAPAVILALIPNIAEWAKTQVDGALGAAGTSAAAVGLGKLAGFGVLYKGLESVGGGSVLAGMVLGAMAVYVIDNKMRHAAGWAFAGAVLSYVGLIHGAQLGLGVSPLVALGYVMFGATCLVLGRGQAGTSAES